ncbi:MAG: fluoride efflux transporter CrcB [Polyangiaceae bacterium]
MLIWLGGALGSWLRYEFGAALARRYGTAFPWGTFVINVTGSFVIGAFLTLAADRIDLDPRWRFFVAIGFCGGYTTFSTFAWETAKLLEGRSLLYAIGNVGGSAVCGVLAVVAGAATARWLA